MKRILLTSLILLALGGSLFFFLSKDTSTLQRCALADLLQGDFHPCEKKIGLIENKRGLPCYLYRGYLKQAMGHLEEADHLFQRALSNITEASAMQEAYLALALNAYLANKFENFAFFLSKGKEVSTRPYAISLFDALINFEKEEFSKAATCFQAYLSSRMKNEETLWLDAIVKTHFSLPWIETKYAQMLLEKGDIVSGRAVIAHLEENACSFLNGLSYLKECENCLLEERESFYKLIAFYFEKIQASEEKKVVAKYIQKEILTLLKANLNDLWATRFTHLLEIWEEGERLQVIADFMASQLVQKETPDLLASFSNIQKQHSISINAKVLHSLLSHISSEQLKELLPGIINSPFSTYAMKKEIASYAFDELKKGIEKDDSSLSSTIGYVKILDLIESDFTMKNPCAKLFIQQGKLCWLKEGEEPKGTALLSTAVNLLEKKQQNEMLQDIEQFFETLSFQAENSNMVKRLTLIFDALEELGLGNPSHFSRTKVANYLADAEYLFSAHNYFSAKIHAELVLKVDTENKNALRLFGLSSYHMGEYKQAFAALKKLDCPDEYSFKAMMLSQAHCTSDEEASLVHVDTLKSLNAADE